MSQTIMTHAEWIAEGRRRFGSDFKTWKFSCPICGNVASVSDYEKFAARGATLDSATRECIGRYLEKNQCHRAFSNQPKPIKAPCDYAGYGLIKISPVLIKTDEGKEIHSFAFAEAA